MKECSPKHLCMGIITLTEEETVVEEKQKRVNMGSTGDPVA